MSNLAGRYRGALRHRLTADPHRERLRAAALSAAASSAAAAIARHLADQPMSEAERAEHERIMEGKLGKIDMLADGVDYDRERDQAEAVADAAIIERRGLADAVLGAIPADTRRILDEANEEEKGRVVAGVDTLRVQQELAEAVFGRDRLERSPFLAQELDAVVAHEGMRGLRRHLIGRYGDDVAACADKELRSSLIADALNEEERNPPAAAAHRMSDDELRAQMREQWGTKSEGERIDEAPRLEHPDTPEESAPPAASLSDDELRAERRRIFGGE